MELKAIFQKWKTEYSILLVCICFYGGLFCLFGVQQFPDTNTYIHMHSDREPLYPLFLAVFRGIFGEGYLTWIAVAQNAFAVLSCYLFVQYICSQFRLRWFGTTCILILALTPHVLTPLSSASRMVLTNSILSEGITFSLYYLFVYYLLKMLWETERGKKDFFLALLVAFVNSLARGQMMSMLIAWGCVAGFCAMRKKKRKELWLVLLCVIMAFGVRSFMVKSYNYFANGSFVGNSGSGTTILTNVMYSALETDGKDIEEGEQKQLFQDIFSRAQEAKLNYRFAEEGIINQAIYHEDTHDTLKFEYVEKYLTWFVSDRIEGVGAIREAEIDKTAMELAKQMIVHSFPRWIYVYFCVAISGFIRTVAIIHPLLNIYALFVYFFAVGLVLYQVVRGRKKSCDFMVLAMLLICANVFATSMTIMCLSRYMIYNLPVFYIALFLLYRDIRSYAIKRKGEQDGI